MRLKDIISETIVFKSISINTPEAQSIISSAKQNRFLGNDILLGRNITGFFIGDELVGFASPRKTGKFYRSGAIFVKPEHRNKKIAQQFIQWYFRDKPGIAYINPANIESISVFSSAGFYPTNKSFIDNNEELQQYIKSM